MFAHGDTIVDTATGDVATYEYRHDATWPDILAIGTWPSGTKVHPGTYGRLFRECKLFIGPAEDAKMRYERRKIR